MQTAQLQVPMEEQGQLKETAAELHTPNDWKWLGVWVTFSPIHKNIQNLFHTANP